MPDASGLTLQVLAGPTPGPFHVDGPGPATLGRSVDCAICLLDDTVSRRHATLTNRRGGWFVTDEDSRAGTFLNGVRLPRAFPAPLASGDLLRVGPWAFRVVIGRTTQARAAQTIDDSASRTQRIERLPSTQRAGLGDRRLKLLSECLARLSGATDEAGAAASALELVLKGSGYMRGAVLRRVESPDGANIEVITSLRSDPRDPSEMAFSKTLIDQASTGETVLLTEDAGPLPSAHSLAEMGVHSAICVPIDIGGPVTGFFYLDARGREGQVRSDAAGFCEAAATAYGLAVSALQRADLERRQRQLQSELDAAREVQTLVMPPADGRIGRLRYCVRSRPGSFVAGDLIDLFEIPGGRTAFCVGDVSGHGVGAAMLMATAQAFLSAELRRLSPEDGPSLAVFALNRFLTARPLAGRFLSLWAGVIDADGTLRYTDAGHGHWLHVEHDGQGRRSAPRVADGGIPIGVDADASYGEGIIRLKPRDEIVVYSDGIIEQRAPGGEAFGVGRLCEAIAGSHVVTDDVARVFSSLERFAGTHAWDDDASVAAVAYMAD